jgi:hypothetical protein
MSIDWKQEAKLLERQDGGSELYVEFAEIGRGPLFDLVRKVAGMDPAGRARLVIDAGGSGMFGQVEILSLAAHPEFPQ